MAVTYENGKISNLVGMKKWLLPTEISNPEIWKVRRKWYHPLK